MADIFLSYAREDKAAAASLAQLLTGVGFSIFWDEMIPAGQSFRGALKSALADARCVVVLWSPHSVSSDWVVDEAADAAQRGMLVPVMIERTTLPHGLRQVQYVNLTDGDLSLNSPRVQRLVADIRQVIERHGQPKRAVAEPRIRSLGTAPDLPLSTGDVIPIIGGPLARADGSNWTAAKWQLAEDEYRDRVRLRLGKTRLLGSDQEVNIESLFTDVHFLPNASASQRLDVNPTSFTDFDELVDHRKKDRFDALEALKQSERLYILGTPGAGKSTFLRHVAVLSATQRLPGRRSLPVFVSMKDWADSGLSFEDFAARELECFGAAQARGVLHALLMAGSACLLFDGLDEIGVQTEERDRFSRVVIDLARRFPACRVAVTCRTSANDQAFEGFRYVEVADFTSEQQVTFVRKWFRHDEGKADLFIGQLSLPSSRALRDLGSKPLFLAFMCIAFDQRLEFPPSKSELYKEAIEVLLNKWDSTRGIRREVLGLDGTKRKKQFLAQLAMRAFQLNQFAIPALLVEAVLRRYLSAASDAGPIGEVEGTDLARSFEAAHGILVERAMGVFSFSHLSIHEYFAGLGLSHAVAAGGQWADLIPIDAVYSSTWHDVLLHVGNSVDNGEALLQYLRLGVAQLLAMNSTTRAVVARCGFIASNDEHFESFSRDPERFLRTRSEFGGGYCEPFRPSTHLEASLTRLERAVLYGLKHYRRSGKAAPRGLMNAWRRVEVLREVLRITEGVALLVGMIGDAAKLDTHLAAYLGSQEVYLLVLEDAIIADRDKERCQILGVAW